MVMLMRYIALLLVLLIGFAPQALAQDEYMDPPTEEAPSGGIFGAGGGVNGIWYFVNANELNQSLQLKSMPELSTDGMFMFGGHGYVYIIVIPNFRIGGMGASGSMSESIIENGMYKSSELSTTFGAFTMEYVIPFGQFHIAIGMAVGGGSNTLTLTRGNNIAKTWDKILPSTPDGFEDSRLELINSFFAYQPTLTFEYDLNPFTVLSLSGGYYGASGDDWKLNDEFTVESIPEFSFNNAFIRLQMTFGLFIGE
jgi:hypothetical protein